MAQRKIKSHMFLYPFSEIAAGKVLVWVKIKLLRCVFGKRGTKVLRIFFGGRSCAVCQVKIMRVRKLGLCRVPRKKIFKNMKLDK